MAGNENVDAVRAFWEVVLNGGDTSHLGNMLSPNYTFNGQAQGSDGVAAWVKSLRDQMPDLHFTIEDLFGDGDKVAIRWTLTATVAKTGKAVTASATNIITIADHLAVSNWQNPANPLPDLPGT